MVDADLLMYLAFGFSFFAAMLPFVLSDHLWKPRFFKNCLLLAAISFFFGVILELSMVLNREKGFAIAMMSIPLIYLGNFQLCRWIFKRQFDTEPYITSASSWVGSQPLDLFTAANRNGEIRKFNPKRKIMVADFVFSFAQALVPAFATLLLIYLTTQR